MTFSLALLLVVLLLVTRAAADLLGALGVIGAAFLGGLADTHTTAAATASLAGAVIPVGVAVLGVGAALLSNTLIKLVLAAAAGGPRFALYLALLLIVPALAVAAGVVLAA